MSALEDLIMQATTPRESASASPMGTLQLLAQLKSLQPRQNFSFGGMTGGTPADASGTVGDWIDRAERIAGISGDANMDNALRILIQHESGGNPTITNPTATPGGYHATGLAQMIPPTFDAYNIEGLGGIHNPVANLVAAIRYMQDRYGGVYNTPGIASVLAGHGYQPY